MFRGQIERPFKAVHILTYSDKRVTVALNPHCLHILDSKNPPVSTRHTHTHTHTSHTHTHHAVAIHTVFKARSL